MVGSFWEGEAGGGEGGAKVNGGSGEVGFGRRWRGMVAAPRLVTPRKRWRG